MVISSMTTTPTLQALLKYYKSVSLLDIYNYQDMTGLYSRIGTMLSKLEGKQSNLRTVLLSAFVQLYLFTPGSYSEELQNQYNKMFPELAFDFKATETNTRFEFVFSHLAIIRPGIYYAYALAEFLDTVGGYMHPNNEVKASELEKGHYRLDLFYRANAINILNRLVMNEKHTIEESNLKFNFLTFWYRSQDNTETMRDLFFDSQDIDIRNPNIIDAVAKVFTGFEYSKEQRLKMRAVVNIIDGFQSSLRGKYLACIYLYKKFKPKFDFTNIDNESVIKEVKAYINSQTAEDIFMPYSNELMRASIENDYRFVIYSVEQGSKMSDSLQQLQGKMNEDSLQSVVDILENRRPGEVAKIVDKPATPTLEPSSLELLFAELEKLKNNLAQQAERVDYIALQNEKLLEALHSKKAEIQELKTRINTLSNVEEV